MLAKHQAGSLETPPLPSPTPRSCRSAHQGRRCLSVEGDQCASSPAALAAAEVYWASSQRLPPSAVHTNAPKQNPGRHLGSRPWILCDETGFIISHSCAPSSYYCSQKAIIWSSVVHAQVERAWAKQTIMNLVWRGRWSGPPQWSFLSQLNKIAMFWMALSSFSPLRLSFGLTATHLSAAIAEMMEVAPSQKHPPQKLWLIPVKNASSDSGVGLDQYRCIKNDTLDVKILNESLL